MSESAYRLVYVSQIAPVTGLTFEFSIKEILITSHMLNWRDAITGLLMSYGPWFAQVLEGPEAKVEACFARIARDPRHVGPQVRARGPVAERAFDRWTMCAKTLSDLDDALLASPDITRELNLWEAPPELIVRMLAALASRYGRELDQLHGQVLEAALGA